MDHPAEIPEGLIRIDGVDTLQGFVLVVPGSPEHAAYAAQVDDAFDSAPKRAPRKKAEA